MAYTYRDFIAASDINYGVSAPGQGGAEMAAQVVIPLAALVLDNVGAVLAARSSVVAEHASGSAVRQSRLARALRVLPAMECALAHPHGPQPEADEAHARAAAARQRLVSALHAAEDAALAYADALRDRIVADALPRFEALVAADSSERPCAVPPVYASPSCVRVSFSD